MADMTFKVNLLPNSTTKEYSLGSSQKRWNIYGDLTGYSSNAISWDNTNKKLQQTVSSSGATDVLSFAAGDGINLTAAASSLTIAAKTVLKSAGIFTTMRPAAYLLGLSDATDNSGNLYKTNNVSVILTDHPSVPNVRLMIGGVDTTGFLTIANNDGINHATLAVENNRSNATTYYLPDYDEDRYLAHVGSVSSTTGDSGMPVYVDTNGAITSCVKSDLQANIFVISDTAPADTSVIWLKPVSSAS